MFSQNAPEDRRELSPVVALFINAVNTADLQEAVSAFANNATVNDQLVEHRGINEISSWLADDILGCHITINIISSIGLFNNDTVTAEIDGAFDKRGLPDPLILTFYFSYWNDKLIQLIILRTALNN